MKHLVICIGLLSFVSCVTDPQDIPPGITEDPAFFAEMTVNGESLTLQAGIDGMTLNVVHEATERGVKAYRSKLGRTDCPLCGPSIEIVFYDNDFIGGPDAGVDLTFDAGNKAFFDNMVDEQVQVNMALQEAPANSDHAVWTNAAGSILSEDPSISFNAQPQEHIDLCYRVLGNAALGAGSCVSSFCFHMLPSQPCIAWVKADRMINNLALVEVEVIGQPPFSFEWMNGATSPFILLPVYDAFATGVYLTVTDGNGCKTDIDQTLQLMNGLPTLCPGSPGFTVDVQQAAFSSFNTVEVIYTDEDGKRYRSSRGEQNLSESLFAIQSVVDYLDAPSGFPTKKIEALTLCTLYSEDGDGNVILETEMLSLAISYDE